MMFNVRKQKTALLFSLKWTQAQRCVAAKSIAYGNIGKWWTRFWIAFSTSAKLSRTNHKTACVKMWKYEGEFPCLSVNILYCFFAFKPHCLLHAYLYESQIIKKIGTLQTDNIEYAQSAHVVHFEQNLHVPIIIAT